MSGLAAAVFLDAFVLRTMLVPALMHLFGKANWYFPRWLERFAPRVSVEPPETREGPVSRQEEYATVDRCRDEQGDSARVARSAPAGSPRKAEKREPAASNYSGVAPSPTEVRSSTPLPP